MLRTSTWRSVRTQATDAARRREPQAQAAGCRLGAGQADPTGRRLGETLRPAAGRERVRKAVHRYGVSVRRACGLFRFHRSSYRYRSVKPPQDALRLRLRELALARPRWGYRRLTVLLQREGWKVNHKRVLRLYREEGLLIRTKRRKKRASEARLPVPIPGLPTRASWAAPVMPPRLRDAPHTHPRTRRHRPESCLTTGRLSTKLWPVVWFSNASRLDGGPVRHCAGFVGQPATCARTASATIDCPARWFEAGLVLHGKKQSRQAPSV